MKNKLTEKQIRDIVKKVHSNPELNLFFHGTVIQIMNEKDPMKVLSSLQSILVMGITKGMGYSTDEANEAIGKKVN